MNRILPRLALLAVALDLLVFLVAACSPSSEPAAAPADAPAMRPVAVRTATAGTATIGEKLEFTGELESPLSVDLASKASGRLDKLEIGKGRPLREGDEVKKDDVLAEIAHGELEAQVSLAGAQVQAAEVALADKARERRRIEALFGENVTTEQARDTAVTAFDNAQAALAQAQAQLRLARVNLAEAFVKAPMDGVVLERYVDPGAMVNSGTPILRLAQMSPLRLMVSVPARMLPMLHPGKTGVSVRFDGTGDRVFDCTVARVFPAVDSATRTARVEVLLDNEKDAAGSWLLRPGMYATATLETAAREDVVTVPAAAVVRVLDRHVLYVAEGSRVRAATVALGVRDGDRVEILSGLAPGDEYVVMGQNKLTDGAPIERVSP